MRSLAIAAIGRDRPGIVAAVTRELFDIGCNLEDTSMTLLRGNFAMMLVVSAPDDTDEVGVRTSLQPVCDELGLTFSVLPVGDTDTGARPTHVLVVHGADRPGIVSTVCGALGDFGVNITDLTSRLVGDAYVLMLELELPNGLDVERLRSSLDAISNDMDVAITLNERSTDIL